MWLRWRTRVGLGVGLGCMTWTTAVWPAPSVQDHIVIGVAQAPSSQTGSPGSSALRLTVEDAVLGILAHTRWPQRRPQALQLCIHERGSHAPDLRSLHESLPPGRLQPVRVVDVAAPLPLDCDAVYLGAGPVAVEPLAQLSGRPVLTIGEGAEFCSSGALFCLLPRPGGLGLRVEVNLDAVARSGLHVHPQALKIGLPRTGATP